MSVKVDPLTV